MRFEHVRALSANGIRSKLTEDSDRVMTDSEMQTGNVRSNPKDLCVVVARIPREALKIEQRYQRDEKFQSICRDYAEACDALQWWQSTAGQDDRRTLDYTHLLEELESELLSYLQAAEAHP